ncbi:MAG: hypothetical protein KF744_07030 [Taibaiella sp.]|nr:hypothetical protein [Taibaiella sp.]
MTKPLEKITKEYPVRGPLKQFRFEKSISFSCFRCAQTKVSKLITINNSDWNQMLCNGCYGRLLSIYEIKSGSRTFEEKSDELSQLLLKLADEHSVKQQSNKIAIKQNQAKFLSPSSMRFFATAEVVANTLTKETDLDWSPAVIGICKAFEFEIVEKFLDKLREACSVLPMEESDIKDKDFGRVASYCFRKMAKSPELGSISHFLITAMNSKERLDKSEFLKNGLKPFIAKRPNANWLIDKNGLASSIEMLTKSFRNKAAHTDELNANDYESCKELVFGEKGVMWELLVATK